jgi:excisionase family DNA binding protein
VVAVGFDASEEAMATETRLPEHSAGAKLDAALYTVGDLARLAQCSERHIWRLIDLGRIPGVIRIGRLVRISRKLADAWLGGEQ